MQRVDAGEETLDEGILRVAKEAADRVRSRYPEGALDAMAHEDMDDFQWGMTNGKFSALRWVLGSEWDFLDT
jgi:hypothetical protein